MAKKRITTVDEILNIDPDADYLLVSRGVQQDLRRILLRRLPPSFDLHDDVTDELAILAGIDRLVISDEGSPGAPQKFVKLSTLRSFLLDLFDLHDDVPTEATEADGADRLLISKEDERGDPQKWISVENLAASINPLKAEKLTTLGSMSNGAVTTFNHSLGKAPLLFQMRFVCHTANNGYAIGDEIYVPTWHRNPATVARVTIHSVTKSSFTAVVGGVTWPPIQNKNNTSQGTFSPSQWRLGFSVAG